MIAKLLNLKDNIQKQVFQGVLYRKLVIWMDLNIQSDEFMHSSTYSLSFVLTPPFLDRGSGHDKLDKRFERAVALHSF